MPRSAEELALVERFDQQYLRGRHALMRDMERRVCGCDYGGTSWTTRGEADEVCRRLKLRRGLRLLDVGAGSGWPALYLARSSGCDVTLVDVPVNGIRIASRRAAAEPSGGRCAAAAGDGGFLPFMNGSFDALSHSDVLCCLPGKAAVLRECRRVIRNGGAMVFTVIAVTEGLTPERRADAVEFGPPYVEAECEYPELLERTGWAVIERVDLTGELAVSVQRYIDAWKENEAGIVALAGREDFDAFIARQSGKLRVLEAGGLCRDLYHTVPA